MSVQSPIRDARSLNPSLSNRQESTGLFGGIIDQMRHVAVTRHPEFDPGPVFWAGEQMRDPSSRPGLRV
jgi:hypothetical protein